LLLRGRWRDFIAMLVISGYDRYSNSQGEIVTAMYVFSDA